MAEKLAKLKLNQNSQKMERSQINKQSEKLTESSRWQNNTIQNHTILKVRPPLNKSEPIELFFKSIKLDNYVLKLKKKYSLIFKKNNYSKLIYHQDTKLEESKIIRKLKQSSQVSQVNIQNESKYDEVEGITIQSQQNLKLTQVLLNLLKKIQSQYREKIKCKEIHISIKGQTR
ncbi:unnamed protein product [Paramecium sonneborni]|uniref:Uncharacterized protein n=1 Tax=Paramecium sonneborni TaxID=65129 RepID=A0A8S1N862_9CILI|nr:unnamed protein product [Paramecium sonneborni]